MEPSWQLGASGAKCSNGGPWERLINLRTEYGGPSWRGDENKEATIKRLLDDAERSGTAGDGLDRILQLPTDAEQKVQLQRDSVNAAQSSARAAWISVSFALAAVIISVIALIRSFAD